MPARGIKTSKKDCADWGLCRFQCSVNISDDERKHIHDDFWSLIEDGKRSFYAKTTEQRPTMRSRGKTDRRKSAISYYFFVNDLSLEFVKNITSKL